MSDFVKLCLTLVMVSPGVYAFIRWRWPHFHEHTRYPSPPHA